MSTPMMLPILFLAAAADAASPPVAACPLPDDGQYACVATAQGWFQAADEAEAASMAEAARQAAELFEHHFQRPAVRGAIIATGSGGGLSDERKEAFRAHGAEWAMPWIGPDDKRRLAETQIRRQIASQLGANADAATIDQTVAKALAQLPGSDDGTANSALRHEIGHLLLMRAFPTAQDGDASGGMHGYGGGLPDWLDETAAVLMEDEAMSQRRRERLRQRLACDHGSLPPLARFFVMEHPLAGVVRERFSSHDANAGSGSRVLMLSGGAAGELAEQGAVFYEQSRALADFLIESSGDAAIFGHIAQALAAGGDMAAWLAAEGAGHGLPADIVALERAWQGWLERIAAAEPGCAGTVSDPAKA